MQTRAEMGRKRIVTHLRKLDETGKGSLADLKNALKGSADWT
jgi:hypothetical protein